MAGSEPEDLESDSDSTYEDVRFDITRERYDTQPFSEEDYSPESEEEKVMCDFPLPRGSFWSGSLTLNSTSQSIDFWVMVAPNTFSSSLWYLDGKVERIRIEWRDDDLIRISHNQTIELVGLFDEDFACDLMGVSRKRGEKTVGEFFLKKRDLSRNVFVSLGGKWIPAHVLEETDDSVECVVLYSKQAVSDDVLSLTLTVREDRIRRGKTIDHSPLTQMDNVLLTILEFTAETGEELQMLSYLSARVQAVTTSHSCNNLWKRLSLSRWNLLQNDVVNDKWRLFYLSRQQFDYQTPKNSQRDYIIDIYNSKCKTISPTIDLLNVGKLRFQFRCPFMWDDMKIVKTDSDTALVVRKCRSSKQRVTYTIDIDDARERIARGEAVAVPLCPNDVDYGPTRDLPFFPEIPTDHKIQINSALPKHLQELKIEGLRQTFENMESRKSYADLVTFIDQPRRRLDKMDIQGYMLEGNS